MFQDPQTRQMNEPKMFRKKKKNPFRQIIPPFFCKSAESDRFFNYLHDSNSISRAQGIISEGFFGRTVFLSDHDHDCLTNLRFADDVMLFATSKKQIRKMMCDFKKATEKVGLRIHPDKTKILSNQSTINSDTKKSILKSVT